MLTIELGALSDVEGGEDGGVGFHGSARSPNSNKGYVVFCQYSILMEGLSKRKVEKLQLTHARGGKGNL